MKKFLVTVKYSKNPHHNPHDKKTGPCPADPDKLCTDVTGEHHTFLWAGEFIHDVSEDLRSRGFHVTRVEEV